MALRDRLRDEVRPYLEPGETIQALFTATGGPSPYLACIVLVLAVLTMLLVGPRLPTLVLITLGLRVTFRKIVATDRAILILKSSLRNRQITVARMPRKMRIGPVSGLWTAIWLDGERIFVSRFFYPDIASADAVAMFSTPPPATVASTSAAAPPQPGAEAATGAGA